jgi:hypothetical protein
VTGGTLGRSGDGVAPVGAQRIGRFVRDRADTPVNPVARRGEPVTLRMASSSGRLPAWISSVSRRGSRSQRRRRHRLRT